MTYNELTNQHPRIPFIDSWRGVALLGMILYHFWFDLWLLGFIRNLPDWHSFAAQIVLIQFLVISGVVNQLKFNRQGSFTKNVKVLLVASSVITLATAGLFPDAVVYFGVLHLLTLAVALTPVVMKLPRKILAAGCILVLATTFLLPFQSDHFGWWLLPVGIIPNNFSSLDYTPIFPWIGWYGLGLIWNGHRYPKVSHPFLSWIGKRSLLIYLLHQPFLFGVLWVIRFFANN